MSVSPCVFLFFIYFFKPIAVRLGRWKTATIAPGRIHKDIDIIPSGEGNLENKGCESSLNCVRRTGDHWPGFPF